MTGDARGLTWDSGDGPCTIAYLKMRENKWFLDEASIQGTDIRPAAAVRAGCETIPVNAMTTSCYWNITCCATKYLQMAAGDKFSRPDPTRTLFLSAVNCVCSPLSPTLCMSDPNSHSPLQSHTASPPNQGNLTRGESPFLVEGTRFMT